MAADGTAGHGVGMASGCGDRRGHLFVPVGARACLLRGRRRPLRGWTHWLIGADPVAEAWVG